MVEDPTHPGSRPGDEATRHAICVGQVRQYVPPQAFGQRDVLGVVPAHRRERTAQQRIIRVVLWSFHFSCLSNGQMAVLHALQAKLRQASCVCSSQKRDDKQKLAVTGG